MGAIADGSQSDGVGLLFNFKLFESQASTGALNGVTPMKMGRGSEESCSIGSLNLAMHLRE